MSTFCLCVKPSSANAGTRVMSVTRTGPQWTGRRLRLRNPERLRLRHGDLVGWSDFYGGSPAHVHVARATDGSRSGWLVWGGTLGLRSLPAEVEDPSDLRRRWWDAPAILWVDDPAVFPDDVRSVVAPGGASAPATVGASAQG